MDKKFFLKIKRKKWFKRKKKSGKQKESIKI